jgi:hypothetical protein
MVIESKTDPKVQLEVDPTYFAQRSSLRPLEYRSHAAAGPRVGGHYRPFFSTGLVTGVAAAGALLSLRWANSERNLILLKAIVQATLTTAFGTAQETSVDLVRVNDFTAPDTGGTAIVLGNACRLAPDMQPLEAAALNVATTAALGAGAGNVEAFPFGTSILSLGNTLGASAGGVLFDAMAGQEHPAIFSANSGFRIRNLFAQGATGVVRFNFGLVLAVVPGEF